MAYQATDLNTIIAQTAEAKAQEKVVSLLSKCINRFKKSLQERKTEESGEYISQ
ncbi:hypothetical protein ACQRCB_06895 [Streptococcus hyointestinalis]|uniref:hypothetical protein n=1 Tax=Streptococcus hyointestinalis TaxID=1337 RepID=UPI003D068D3F